MTTTPSLPYDPALLRETSHLLDKVVWTYRRAIEQTPRAYMTAEHICLADYAARTDGLIRLLIEDDRQKGGAQSSR
jgi:hypothetical protein